MLLESFQKLLWQLRPVALRVQVVHDVVTVVECEAVVRAVSAVVGQTEDVARVTGVDKNVLAPAVTTSIPHHRSRTFRRESVCFTISALATCLVQ